MKKKAFTLIEIFVVIGMLLVLVSILVTVYYRAKERVRAEEQKQNVEPEQIFGEIVNIQPTSAHGGQYLFITFKDGRYLRFFMDNEETFMLQKGANQIIYHVNMRITKIVC